jgi:DUF1680 family protein
VTVDSTSTQAPWTLSLRVPDWCHDAALRIDGMPVETDAVDAPGYLRVTRGWPAGTAITLDLHMPPKMVRAHQRVDAVRGCVALTRGPLVYCFEQADLPADVDLDDVSILGTPVATTGPVLDVPVTLRVRGTVRAHPKGLYRESGVEQPVREGHDIELTAIPYYRWANRLPGPMRVWMPEGGRV